MNGYFSKRAAKLQQRFFFHGLPARDGGRKMMKRKSMLAICMVMGLPSAAAAQGLVYAPLNPGLGGNPDLTGYLSELASIQNNFDEGGGGGGFPVIDFPDIDIDLGGGIGGGGSGDDNENGDGDSDPDS
ncbi:curli assembly protein CsgF [Histidinibacterium aquaticum]|nr:curli assembly protein CsgF [Histidinibacterium aquaticum]